MNPIIQPENYTDDAAAAAAAKADGYTPAVATVDEQEYPDIILILSESFYDFDLVTDTQADADVMAVTKNLPNSIYGHTVSPHVAAAPTRASTRCCPPLADADAEHHAVQLAETVRRQQHCQLSGRAGLRFDRGAPVHQLNYRRNSAWLALGFDKVYLRTASPPKNITATAPYQTDSASYRDFAALYEAMPEDQPRFGFLVSIQSHGDYDMNDASLDLVHAATDYGEYDELMDEYLSCMYMTDRAFAELTEYFTEVYEQTGRKVIVAMAGDHAPSFVSHVADKSIAPENDLQLLERSTPYIIWANYPLENAGQTSETDPLNRIDMCTLAPVVAEQAGLPLTPFYRYSAGDAPNMRRCTRRATTIWTPRAQRASLARMPRWTSGCTGISRWNTTHRHPCAAQPGAVSLNG